MRKLFLLPLSLLILVMSFQSQVKGSELEAVQRLPVLAEKPVPRFTVRADVPPPAFRPVILPVRQTTSPFLHAPIWKPPAVNSVMEHHVLLDHALRQTAAANTAWSESTLQLSPEAQKQIVWQGASLAASLVPISRTMKWLTFGDIMKFGKMAVDSRTVAPEARGEFAAGQFSRWGLGKIVSPPLQGIATEALGKQMGPLLTAATVPPLVDTSFNLLKPLPLPVALPWTWKAVYVSTGRFPEGGHWENKRVATYSGSVFLPHLQQEKHQSIGTLNGTTWMLNSETTFKGKNFLEDGWTSRTTSSVKTTPLTQIDPWIHQNQINLPQRNPRLQHLPLQNYQQQMRIQQSRINDISIRYRR